MEHEFFFAITLFGFVMSVTPGPNNMMLLASGAQFGYRRTLPHILGIIIGIAVLLASVLIGLGVLFKLYPILYQTLKVLGAAYLLWLAWKIANASIDEESFSKPLESTNTVPMKLFSALLFQFINPKAWAMCIGSVSTFTLAGERYIESGLWIMAAFATTGFIAISLWACLGVAIGRFLTSRKRKRNFNWLMGAMTASTLLMMIAD
jgi:threonine/homoserine/homoserine lactone efflux protein